MGFFDDVASAFSSVPKRTMGGAIGFGLGSGMIKPSQLAKGSKNVPKTQLYKLHKGEIVIPAKQANMIRNRLKKKDKTKKNK